MLRFDFVYVNLQTFMRVFVDGDEYYNKGRLTGIVRVQTRNDSYNSINIHCMYQL